MPPGRIATIWYILLLTWHHQPSHLSEDLAVGADGMSRAQVTTWSLDSERSQVDGPTLLGCWDKLREKNIQENLKVSSRATRRLNWSWTCYMQHTYINKKKHRNSRKHYIAVRTPHDLRSDNFGCWTTKCYSPAAHFGPWECLVPIKVTRCHQPVG